MDAGELRERVTVLAPTETRNRMGEVVLTYTDVFAEVWASVDGVSAREYLLSGQQQVDISHRVKMRYLPGLTQSMRILWRGRTLEIISVLERDVRAYHELICQEMS